MTDAERLAAADSEDAAINAALMKQRYSGNKNFVIIERATKHLPGLRSQLEAEAKNSGRILLNEALEPPAARMLRERAARLADAPVVSRADHGKFLDNLKGIATGKIRCD